MIRGDLGISWLLLALPEWRLPSIQWAFVVDNAGEVSAKFEEFATFDEMKEAFNRAIIRMFFGTRCVV